MKEKGDFLTLRQIKYAITIYETGQFSKAAEKLYVAQPSLTKAINELEKELDLTLFIRTRKGIVVTEDGEEFISYAKQAYTQYEILTDRFKNKEFRKQKFGVSCQHYSFAVKAFMETIRQFESAKYEFAIRETKTADVIHDVSTMRSELGIIFISDFNEKFISHILAENGLAFQKLIECRPYVFICRDHPLFGREYVTLEDLRQYPCFVFEQGGSDPYYYAEELLPMNEYSRVVKTGDKLTMLSFIAEMNGYTFCSGMIYDKLNGKDFVSLTFMPENRENPDIRIGYIYKNGRPLSEIGRTYLRNVEKYLNEHENQIFFESKPT